MLSSCRKGRGEAKILSTEHVSTNAQSSDGAHALAGHERAPEEKQGEPEHGAPTSAILAFQMVRPTPSTVLGLQRTFGNRAVQRMVARREFGALPRPPTTNTHSYDQKQQDDTVVQPLSRSTGYVQAAPDPGSPKPFVPAPAPGVFVPPPPLPGTPAAIKSEATRIGTAWGTLLGERDVALETLQTKWAGVSVWDRMKPEERSAWAKNAESEFAKLPVLPQYDKPDLVAAQEEGFSAGIESGYSGAKFAAFLVKLGSELAIALFSGVAARGLRLPRFITQRLQLSLPQILGAAEYESMKAAAKAAQAAHPELAGLQTDELIAIRAYSGESWSSINAALRTRDAQALMRQGQMIELMKSGLAKLPAYQGKVTRTIALSVEDAAQKYKVGATVVEDAFTSTTFGKGVAQREGNVLLNIESSTGRNITSIAAHAESEVLFAPGAKFQVSRVQKVGDAFLVWMTELP
jgi:hypothetical protein